MVETQRFIVIDTSDNTATAIVDIPGGTYITVVDRRFQTVDDIQFGHKFAICDIPEGGYVMKYGAQIGRATRPISAGQHVHIHNVEDIVDEVRKNYDS